MENQYIYLVEILFVSALWLPHPAVSVPGLTLGGRVSEMDATYTKQNLVYVVS